MGCQCRECLGVGEVKKRRIGGGQRAEIACDLSKYQARICRNQYKILRCRTYFPEGHTIKTSNTDNEEVVLVMVMSNEFQTFTQQSKINTHYTLHLHIIKSTN